MQDAIAVKGYLRGWDWQYLIILDACRYDTFADIAQERGWDTPLKLDTQCHLTAWWYRKFWSRVDNDIHLISANPVPFSASRGWNAYRRFKSAIWADPAGRAVKAQPELAAIWADCKAGGWSIFEPAFALRIFEAVKQPGERYLIHLMPPHLPFLGPKGRTLFKRLGLSIDGDRYIYKAVQGYGREGNWDELRACYKENVEYALDAVLAYWHLFADGKTAITSDHAEIVGEIAPWDGEGLYRHAKWAKIPELFAVLRTVPWLEMKT